MIILNCHKDNINTMIVHALTTFIFSFTFSFKLHSQMSSFNLQTEILRV